MYQIPDTLRKIPDYNQYVCDGCSKKLCGNLRTSYLLLNNRDGVTVCHDCYDKLDNENGLTRRDGKGRICDVCMQYVQRGNASAHCWGLGDCFDVCSACHPHFKKAFMQCTPENLKQLIYTERECVYRCSNSASHPSIEIPDSIKDRITEELKADYIAELESVVRPPSYDWDAAEWALISCLAEVPSYPAECCFAVRCVAGQHQVASVVADDHGRIAMNIVFDNLDDFLKAEKEFLAQLPSAEQLDAAKEEVQRFFDEEDSCKEEVMMKATSDFAVYERLKRKLCMYYG